MAKISDANKSRCRYHLGYLASSFAASFQLGIPKPLQTIFILEDAMNLTVEDGAVARISCILDTMDRLESQMMSATTSLGAAQLGNLRLHPLAAQGKLFTDSLEREYRRWGERLADILGVPPYPYSTRYQGSGPGTIMRVG